MIQGVLIAESLRTETTLDDLRIVVSKITRFRPRVTTRDQASVWTLLHFEVDEARAENLAHMLASALDEPGWYADFFSPYETFVVSRVECFATSAAMRVVGWRQRNTAGRSTSPKHNWIGQCDPIPLNLSYPITRATRFR
jgi:hypothetical protein